MLPSNVRDCLVVAGLLAGLVALPQPARAQAIYQPIYNVPAAALGTPLRPVATHAGTQLVYEYEGNGGMKRLTVDPSPLVNDIERTRKAHKPGKRQPEAKPPRAPDRQAERATVQQEKSQPRAEPVSLSAETPRAERKVRIIPLFKMPEDGQR